MGPDSDPARTRKDPYLNIDQLIANNTRLWIYCGSGDATDLDQGRCGLKVISAGVIEGRAIVSDKKFAEAYGSAGGTNAYFDFPAGDIHNQTYRGNQLRAMKTDAVGYLNKSPSALG